MKLLRERIRDVLAASTEPLTAMAIVARTKASYSGVSGYLSRKSEWWERVEIEAYRYTYRATDAGRAEANRQPPPVTTTGET